MDHQKTEKDFDKSQDEERAINTEKHSAENPDAQAMPSRPRDKNRAVGKSLFSIISIKRYLPRTLLGRSLLILVIPIFLMQVITTVVFFDRHWNKMTERFSFAVAGEIAITVRAIENEATPETIAWIKQYLQENLELLVEYKGGRTWLAPDLKSINAVSGGVEGSNNAFWEYLVTQSLAAKLKEQMENRFYIDADFKKKWVNVFIEVGGGILKVSLPQNRLFSSSGYIFLIWMFASSLLLLAVAIVFMRNQIRPIRRLAIASEWFGRGRDVQNFKLEGALEVRQAGKAFIDMQRRIRRQIEQRTLMLAGVSHDLRTPLTRLKLQLEMMDATEDVQGMKSDLFEMERMLSGYLDFVRGDGGEHAQKVNVKHLIDKVSVNLDNNIAVNVDVVNDLDVCVRPLAMERCLGNIVRNAAKFADQIWVQAKETEEDRIRIVIEDNGPGIPEEQFEDVFRPFIRLDESRNAATGGVGLGLSIAMDVVHNHGGKIWLEPSHQHGGLKVVIRLPI